MKKQIFLALFISIAYTNLFAQEKCGSSLDMEKLRINNPAYYQKLMLIEQHTQNRISTKNNGIVGERIVSPNVTVTIPVVVHIIHNGEAIGTGANISVAQIQSQIDVLNEDFRRLNADRTSTPAPFALVASDVNIEFRLACTDPNGNPSNGIIRVQGNSQSFTAVFSNGLADEIATGIKQNSPAWRSDWYLNIWVCNLTNNVLGYATFPGGDVAFDGVVVESNAFGRIGSLLTNVNKGRTATHEVGHWLNLRHIWGDDGSACTGTDLVNDTPNQADATFGCPSFPQISCNNPPNGNMFMNYMDYTNDQCMNMFTNGQKDRMRALFTTGGARESFISLAIRENNNLVCSTTPTFSVEPNTGATVNYQWTVTGPLQITSGQGTNQITCNKTGDGSATITISAQGLCFTKTVWVGKPTITYSPPGSNPCTNNPYYTGTNMPNWTYQWTVDNPNIWFTSGSNASTTAVISRDPYYFNITLTITSGNCSTSQTISTYTDGYYCQCFFDPSCPGQGGSGFGLMAYPMPSSEELNLEVTEEASNTNETSAQNSSEEATPSFTFQIYNPQGTMLYEHHTTDKKLKIKTSQLPEGIYYLHFVHPNGVLQKQILIQH